MALADAVFWLPPQGSSRRLALAAIAQLRQPKSAPVLAGSLVSGTAHESLRQEEVRLVLFLCKSSGNPAELGRVIDVLTEAFEVDDDHIAHRAEDFLVWLGEDAVPAVRALARSGVAPNCAVRVLGQIGGEAALEPLIEAVGHRDALARAAACHALGELRDPIAIDALIQAAQDPEHGVRVEAAAALERIGIGALMGRMSAGLPRRMKTETSHPPPAAAGENGSLAKGRGTGNARRSSVRA